jgi:molecular chaperone DnaK
MHPPLFALGSCRVRKTVGIDLGTTNSVISLLDPVDSALLTGQDERGHRTFPSLVGYHPQQEKPIAGWAALDLPDSATQHALPLASVKRYMGTERRFRVGPCQLSPVEASACILVHLRDVMAATLTRTPFLPGHTLLLDSAIITMPAYFNHAQIEATRQAGEQAGFEVAELIHEPTAAAIYYSWLHKHGDATYLVYDLGGGTFDVSIIRRRLDDYEVVAVSGDPFLGGDDFDRLLASFLIERGQWTWQQGPSATPATKAELNALFEITTPAGATAFARLVRLAEGVKCSLTEQEQVSLFNPRVLTTPDQRNLGLECPVTRSNLNKLLAGKVQRTIECCQEALARARERAGLQLEDIDHVILVGGSSRVPLVRETVRDAFCNPDRPAHARSPHLLLHEPDLCVAYGAALRAATHGTHYLFSLRSQEPGVRSQESGVGVQLDLHLTHPTCVKEITCQATGMVRCRDEEGEPLPAPFLDGGSVRIRSLATGLTEEAFLDDRGTFAQPLELVPDTDNSFEWVVCDHDGQERGRVVAPIRHQGEAHPLGPSVLPTQLITRPLQIEVLTRGRQRVKQVVAPLGAPLPGVFSCTCRTTDQSGRVVVPIFEENRVIKQLVVENLSPRLPVGSPVEVEFRIDVRHSIEVRVRVRQGAGQSDRCEQITLAPPPPPGKPTHEEVEQVRAQIEELAGLFTGAFRSRVRARAHQLSEDLLEALRYDDEPRAIQRMAELRDLVQQLEANREQSLDPPWARFMQLVNDCRDLAVEVARTTGRALDELLEHVRAQERYAEQAWEDHNANLYRECQENLQKYSSYLRQLLADALPRASSPSRPAEEEARDEVERFRAFLSRVWKQVREKQRNDLEPRLAEVANQARGMSQKVKTDAGAVLRDVRRLGTEIEKVAAQIDGTARPGGEEEGLLEGSR